ncbi:spermatogenesis-associated protein 6 [Phyllopteryx taeniolatus]|uniref:spermatogenesis-associated protein 6 n=1 Tax=Phyllopteryx taeniolatus TaxID=161469 RepID=UPI002AD231AC|nr:spermatogenesis-associated protein 6 [Phyllopteryx taeniolatus]
MATKKLSFSQLHRNSWKCTVLLDIHTVTCRGVRLPKSGDIYLSVCIMGQCMKTSCLPPRFPLHFNQRLVFEKTYTNAVDPTAVAERLKADTTTFRLIQSASPESKSLATMTQNSRDFLNPGPSLSAAEDSLQRDALMMERSSRFHGTFPTVEFSVTSFIEECDWIDASPVKDSMCDSKTNSVQQREMTSHVPVRPSSTSPRKSSHYPGWSKHRRSPSPPPCRHISCKTNRRPQKHRVCLEPGYQQPTVASTTRALSPYTHRKMCQLSLDAEQRLKHLQLGPHYFRKETESLPPFLVSTCSSLTDAPLPQSYMHCCHTVSLLDDDSDSLLDSYRPRASIMRSDRAWSSPGPLFRRDELNQSPLQDSSASPMSKRRGPVTFKHPLTERLQQSEPSPSYWEQIHSRVQKILLTHRVPLDLD